MDGEREPLFCQKWSPEICVEKVEPCKIHNWEKLYNIPLEAWTSKGTGALASRLGQPLVMDNMTASMWHKGIGRAVYARVLVEIVVGNGFLEKIEVQYIYEMNNVMKNKFVNVEYTWKPQACAHFEVFGHGHRNCKKQRISIVDHSNGSDKISNGKTQDGFTEVRNKKNDKRVQGANIGKFGGYQNELNTMKEKINVKTEKRQGVGTKTGGDEVGAIAKGNKGGGKEYIGKRSQED
ncbi:hypothetical protein CTI12_AA129610 [Artemisia annua]|uniref:Uncharacterized protein n=1 Tax=Artemisia annua TaxID=35608 RepID=A0A2U1PNX3_ARTAN|nr:hypothetical protein CTI12_AA129610 [Artemisia annua]